MKEIRILVIDCNPHFRRSVCAWLAVLPGITHVASAASGAEALGLLETAAPDLVLMDIQISKMNGLEVTRSIKSRENGVVIVVTSFTHFPVLHDEAIRNGADHSIAKTRLFSELPGFLAQQFGHSPTTA